MTNPNFTHQKQYVFECRETKSNFIFDNLIYFDIETALSEADYSIQTLDARSQIKYYTFIIPFSRVRSHRELKQLDIHIEKKEYFEKEFYVISPPQSSNNLFAFFLV